MDDGLQVGAIEIQPVLDGVILSTLPASGPLPDVDSDEWRQQHGMFRADGRIESTLGGFLVRTGDRVALVDAGAGPDIGPWAPPGRDQLGDLADHFADTAIERGQLPASLAALGLTEADVTDVVFTHLHFDHIGWAGAFPNATYRCAAADLDHFLDDPEEERFTAMLFGVPTASERLAPVLDRVETWDSDQTLLPGVDVRLTPGHTPGSSVVVVSDGDDRAMLLGDMIHCPLELMDDDFDFLVDVDPVAAQQVREAYARELEGSGVAVSAAHFPGLQFGRLLPGEGVRQWTF